jgi:hypothetical protein
MRIPNRILEHPVEAVIAGVLLLGLLFGSAESHAPQAKTAAQMASSEKM